ncbi:hypothetical protein Dimus_012715 [Dionaea muscipula]
MRRTVSRNMIECTNCARMAVQSTLNDPLLKTVPLPFAMFSTCTKLHLLRAVPVSFKAIETSYMRIYCNQNSLANFGHEQSKSREILQFLLESEPNLTAVAASTGQDEETLRRKKIGLANQGRDPWNKGITHSAETRARIAERRVEAMKDPKATSLMKSRRKFSLPRENDGKGVSNRNQICAAKSKREQSRARGVEASVTSSDSEE